MVDFSHMFGLIFILMEIQNFAASQIPKNAFEMPICYVLVGHTIFKCSDLKTQSINSNITKRSEEIMQQDPSTQTNSQLWPDFEISGMFQTENFPNPNIPIYSADPHRSNQSLDPAFKEALERISTGIVGHYFKTIQKMAERIRNKQN